MKEQTENQNINPELKIAVLCAVEVEDICVSLAFVVFALGSTLPKEWFPALKKQAGNKNLKLKNENKKLQLKIKN